MSYLSLLFLNFHSPFSKLSSGALGFCGAPSSSRPSRTEPGDDWPVPKAQYGSGIRKLPAVGGEPYIETGAAENTQRVRREGEKESSPVFCADGLKCVFMTEYVMESKCQVQTENTLTESYYFVC